VTTYAFTVKGSTVNDT